MAAVAAAGPRLLHHDCWLEPGIHRGPPSAIRTSARPELDRAYIGTLHLLRAGPAAALADKPLREASPAGGGRPGGCQPLCYDSCCQLLCDGRGWPAHEQLRMRRCTHCGGRWPRMQSLTAQCRTVLSQPGRAGETETTAAARRTCSCIQLPKSCHTVPAHRTVVTLVDSSHLRRH